MNERLSVSLRWLWLLLILAGIALGAALSHESMLYAYDAAVEHIYRGVVFSDALSQGVLYPRWVQFLHLGLGSPLFTFHPPLAYYAQDILSHLGLPHPLGWQWLIAGGLLAASVGAYLLARELTGSVIAGIVAGVAYLYAPYVLRNALVRGSTEALSMFLFPWVLWGIIWVARRPTPGRFVVAALLWAACISAHVLGPLILAPFAVLLALIVGWHYRTPAPFGVLLAGGLLIAGFWMPIIGELQHIHVERDFSHPSAIPADNPIPTYRLLAPPAIYDETLGNNNVGDRIGLVHFVILLIGVPASIVAWFKGRRRLALALVGAVVAGLFLFWLLTPSSDPFWRLAHPLLGHVQYRTRLMGVQALAMALVAGGVAALLPDRWRNSGAGLLTGLFILVAIPSLYVVLQHQWVTYDSFLSMQGVREAEIRLGGRAFTAFAEFMPRWRTDEMDQDLVNALGPMFDPERRPLADMGTDVRVDAVRVRPHAWDLTVETGAPRTLTLHLLYYPRWQATLNGVVAPLQPQAGSGFTQIQVPAGTHQIALRYGRTPAEWIGLGVSGVMTAVLLAMAGYAIWRRLGRRLAGPVPSSPSTVAGCPPPWWLLAILCVIVALKLFYIDPHTDWLRCASTPERLCVAHAAEPLRAEFHETDGFDGAVTLVGISLPQRDVRPGGWLHLDLYWIMERPAHQPAFTFVHLLGQSINPQTGNPLWGQENKDLPGEHPVTEWATDKIYRDRYSFRVADAALPGDYALEIGWWSPSTGDRLPPDIIDAGKALDLSISHLDSLLVGGIRVR